MLMLIWTTSQLGLVASVEAHPVPLSWQLPFSSIYEPRISSTTHLKSMLLVETLIYAHVIFLMSGSARCV